MAANGIQAGASIFFLLFPFFLFGRGINALERPLYIYCSGTLNNPTKNRAVNFLIFIEL